MDLYTVILIIICLYSIIIFFDLFFKSCAHYPYVKLLDGLGLTVSYFSIKWKTKSFNRLLIKWGNTKSHLWTIWFDIGVYSSIAFLIIIICTLFANLIGLVAHKNQQTQVEITPIIPGVNLPISELGYYAFTLLLCSIVHELGHALAAVLEDVGLTEFGCNLLFILPVAYVSLPTDRLATISLKRQLRIITAGVWHNIVLSFMGYLIFCSLPSLFRPIFEYNAGVSVYKISSNSPLKDSSKGLFIGDVIININNCPIENEENWYQCLNNKDILRPAICISSDLVHTKDESVPLKHLGNGFVECCAPNQHKNLCFEYIDISDKEIELPGHVCLPGRTVMEEVDEFCTEGPHECNNGLYCFKPVLPNNTYLFKMILRDRNVIYLGHSTDLINTIEISSYIKKTDSFPVELPTRLTKLVKYIVIISLGVAFVNILPFLFMDGEYILRTLLLIILAKKMTKKKIISIARIIIWLSTAVLVVYLIYSIILML